MIGAGEATAFAFIAAITLAGGLFSALAKRTFHAALGLGVALVGVAMFYILLNAPFIGVIQVLVYVGGILTLLVFAVMFVAGDEEEDTFHDSTVPGLFVQAMATILLIVDGALLLAAVGLAYQNSPLSGGLNMLLVGLLPLALIAVFAYRMYKTSWTRRFGVGTAFLLFIVMAAGILSTQPWLETPLGGAEDMDAIANDLFSDHLIAFEVLGVLLTAAMIGALVIARPLVTGMDSDVYKPANAEELAKSQAVSQLGATFAATPLPARDEEPTPAIADEGGEEE